jgi:hypothetical protein
METLGGLGRHVTVDKKVMRILSEIDQALVATQTREPTDTTRIAELQMIHDELTSGNPAKIHMYCDFWEKNRKKYKKETWDWPF